MRDVRVSLLLVVASLGLGCAQGAADWAPPDIDGADTEELTPAVVTTRRDAGTADTGADDDEPLDHLQPDVPDPTDEPDLTVRPPPVVEPDITPIDASVVDPVTDAALPAPPLTTTMSACIAGAYVGTFNGELRALNGVVRIGIVGVIRFELPATETDALTLAAGTIEGRDADGHPVKATVSGVLNCVTGELEQGKISAGTYTRPDPVFRGVTTTAKFTGTLAGKFTTGDSPSAKGTWTADSERTTRSGNGDFEVQLAK
jgi:hypothetical protein